MAQLPPALIAELVLDQASRTGTVKLQGNNTIYRLANNSDTGYVAMATALSAAKTADRQVILDVDSANELDKVILK